jgi:uncharacterized protein YkuJ
LTGCSWFDNGVVDETSEFVEGGELVVWYSDPEYDFSLELPEEMEDYTFEKVELDGENDYGTIERVNFMVDGGSVAVLSIHERSRVKANLSNFAHVAESSDSTYLFSFANMLNAESDLQKALMDRTFDLGDYFTFE